jgi:hypothetical protein
MAEPTTYAGYKVGTLIALMLGSGAAAGLTPGPWYLRLFAGFCGASVAFVFTPVFSPLALSLFAYIYGLAGVPPQHIPAEGLTGVTGFVLAITGIDVCRTVIDRGKTLMAKIPLQWGGKSKP